MRYRHAQPLKLNAVHTLPAFERERLLTSLRRVSPKERREAEALPHKSAGPGLLAMWWRIRDGVRAAFN